MPTLLLEKGFSFFFYSNENNEPIHVHVKKGDAEAKIWLEPFITIAWIGDFTKTEENTILEIIKVNAENFKLKWNEYFSSK